MKRIKEKFNSMYHSPTRYLMNGIICAIVCIFALTYFTIRAFGASDTIVMYKGEKVTITVPYEKNLSATATGGKVKISGKRVNRKYKYTIKAAKTGKTTVTIGAGVGGNWKTIKKQKFQIKKNTAKLSAAKTTVAKGKSFKVTWKNYPTVTKSERKNVKWTSSNSKVLKITKTATNKMSVTVKAVKPGKATISCKYRGVTYKTEVTVNCGENGHQWVEQYEDITYPEEYHYIMKKVIRYPDGVRPNIVQEKACRLCHWNCRFVCYANGADAYSNYWHTGFTDVSPLGTDMTYGLPGAAEYTGKIHTGNMVWCHEQVWDRNYRIGGVTYGEDTKVKIVDKPAYTKKVLTGYKCSVCDETKEAEYEKPKAFVGETVECTHNWVDRYSPVILDSPYVKGNTVYVITIAPDGYYYAVNYYPSDIFPETVHTGRQCTICNLVQYKKELIQEEWMNFPTY